MIKQYDNGLSDEQQKIVDARYEELMKQLKEVNPHYYAYIMNELKEINVIGYRCENISHGLCKSEHVSGENISHNKPINNLNYKQLELSL